MKFKIATTSNQQLYIILLITLMGFIGVSIAYPLFAPLFLNSASSIMVATPWAEKNRNLLLGLTLAAYPLGQFIGSPIIGALSDRYGRRSILLSSLVGTLLGYILSALTLRHGLLWLLIFSRFLTGLSESNIALAQTIIADLKDINKHKGFGGIMMAASIGYILGPMMGGLLSDNRLVSWFDVSVPFYAAAGLALLTLFLAYTALPETYKPTLTAQTAFWQQFNILQHLKEMLRNAALRFLLIACLIFMLGVDVFYEFGPVYLTAIWHMDATEIAFYTIILCLGLALSSGWLSHQLSCRYPLYQSILVSIISFCLLLSAIALAHSAQVVLVLYGVIGIAISIATTSLRVQISDTAGQHIQGKVMGMLMGLRMLGDAMLCLFGGALIHFSATLPLYLGVLSALIAATLYLFKVSMEINGNKRFSTEENMS
ncbi:MFS transporter [Aquicella lusitana]|uniref:Putative MFS family arabinose efflux permease n=1 Tax=Aquicella lusitana TaxID=254246 RepID=A0A370GE50_9COXI|nr:MFS transporter [Aquicella lusitana]RDI42078.1 putative MFS family arabinose efflux permease [Aquicella lusitana]VVC74415.1 Tetracycline resistance protein, class C [Aquicella lusitana]